MVVQNRKFRNEDLSNVSNIAKAKGYKVYTFESSNCYIDQIFFVDQLGRIGSASQYFSGIVFHTIHISKRNSGLGTGFRIGEEFEDPKNLDISFSLCPNWAINQSQSVTKYKNWNDYITKNSILKYYEL